MIENGIEIKEIGMMIEIRGSMIKESGVVVDFEIMMMIMIRVIILRSYD